MLAPDGSESAVLSHSLQKFPDAQDSGVRPTEHRKSMSAVEPQGLTVRDLVDSSEEWRNHVSINSHWRLSIAQIEHRRHSLIYEQNPSYIAIDVLLGRLLSIDL